MKKLVFIFLALFSFSTVVFAQTEYSPQLRCINKSICLGMTFDEINKSVPQIDRFPTLSALKTEKMQGFDVGVKSYFFDDVRLKGSVGLGFLNGVLFKIIVVDAKGNENLNLTDEDTLRDVERRAVDALVKQSSRN
jgi:hypothetical protein